MTRSAIANSPSSGQKSATYPLLFTPLLKPKVWGGRWLANLGKKLPPEELIGESWELADLPETIDAGRSIISNGPLSGQTLRQAIVADPKAVIGDGKLTDDGGFPLLIKYLDAQQNLSVQVHPDEKYAANHLGAHLKSEAWVVVHALPGAVIYKGVKPHVKPRDFAQHIRDNTVVDDLISVPVKAGDCHYLPSGTCHALGAGIVVAEVQTPSDTTFRVYDWGRQGAGRDLHIEQALQCIHFGEPAPPAKPPRSFQTNGIRTTPLVNTDYFELARLELADQDQFPVEVSGLPEVWMMLEGGGLLQCDDVEVTNVLKGSTVLIPPAAKNVIARLEAGSAWLRVQLPSSLRGMIA